MFRRVHGSRRSAARAGFTLLEVLVATVITLIMTALVVEMFAMMSDSIFNSRANIELSDQLRTAKHRLIQDLRGVTAPTVPPLDPASDMGYFEYVEGGNVANTIGGDFGSGSISGTTVASTNTITGDLDDILMFTTCSFDEPFVGRANLGQVQRARFAEVAWFVRQVPGQSFCNLYRDVFLVVPQATMTSASNIAAAHILFDYSLKRVSSTLARSHTPYGSGAVQKSTLGDLTRRECRSVHQPWLWPHDMMYSAVLTTTTHRTIGTSMSAPSFGVTQTLGYRFWPQNATPVMGLPTLMERTRNISTGQNAFTHHNISTTSLITRTTDRREHEDLMLTNVISFDVKAWDPGAPVFRASPGDNGSQNVVGLIAPGDPGYGGGMTFPKGALRNFMDQPTRPVNQPVAFGAFADLNYMWVNGQSGFTNVTSSASTMNRYLSALAQFEVGSNLVRKEGLLHLPRPSFAFATPGRMLSGYPMVYPNNHTITGFQLPAVYDTWSKSYEYDGVDNDGDGMIDEGTNGIDDNGNGYVDEPPVALDANGDGAVDGAEAYNADRYGEQDAPPPWDAPLRGIKVSIRVLEPDSRNVREVSTVHEFIPF